MATVNKTFSVKNGLDVANTIVLSNASGVLNVSNITMMNVNGAGSILNVSGNIANAGNLLVTQNTFSGNLAISSNASIGNLTVTQNATFGNISVANISLTGVGANLTSLNVSANISNTGNLLVTQNTFTGNLSVSSNTSIGNLSVTQNSTFGNVTASNGIFSGGVTIAGNLIVNGSTVTLNSSIVQTNDQYILLTANNQLADSLDYGIAGLAKNVTVGNAWSGLIKHHTDEIWYLFDGFAQTTITTLNTASLNLAQTNVATMNANVFAQYINVTTLNVGSILNPIAQFANSGVYVAGVLVANNPNINFVAANTSNLSIIGTSNVSPGNVTITLDTRTPGSGGGTPGGLNTYIQFDNTGAFGGTTNLTFNLNGNVMNVWSVNVQANISNTGNLLVTQNTFTGNLSVSSNAAVGNISVTQNVLAGNASITTLANVGTLNVSSNIANTGNLLVTQNTFTGNLSVAQNAIFGNLSTQTGILSVNSLTVLANTITVATVSQTGLANIPSTGALATIEALVQANCLSNFYSTKLLIVNDGTNTYLTEYATVLTNGPVGSLTASIAAGNVQLLWTSNNVTSTVVRTAIYGLAV